MSLDGLRIFNLKILTVLFCLLCLVTIQSVAFADNETSNEQASVKTTDKIYYKDTDLKTIKIFGEAVSANTGDKVTIAITEPNGDRGGSQIFLTKDGYYETFHLVQSNSQLGTYQIDASFRGKVVGTIYFEIAPASEKPVPVVEEKVEPVKEEKPVPVVEEKPKVKPILSFVDQNKDPGHYVERYINEKEYQKWFNEHFSDYTIWEGVGITQQEYRDIVNDLNAKRQESKTQTQDDIPGGLTTSQEDIRNQMGMENPQTYEQSQAQSWAMLDYAKQTGQYLDPFQASINQQNAAAKQEWENKPFLEKYGMNYLTLTLGLTSLGLIIPAIVVPIRIKRKRQKTHSNLPLSLPGKILLVVGGVMWFVGQMLLPWPFGSIIWIFLAIAGLVLLIIDDKKKSEITLPNVEYSKRARASESSGADLLLSCRKCNGPVHEDEEFCGKCGSSTVPKPSVRRGIRCENCKSPLKSGEEFCGKCGCPHVPKTNDRRGQVCVNCYNLLKASEEFCGKCGKPV